METKAVGLHTVDVWNNEYFTIVWPFKEKVTLEKQQPTSVSHVTVV